MAKTTKKPAPKKGGAKKAAPKKAVKRQPVMPDLSGRGDLPRTVEEQFDVHPHDCYGVAPPLHPTVEEQWDALRPVEQRTVIPAVSTTKPPKRSLWHRFRSAVTGLFVSKKYAEANPDTTVRERVKP